jgi:hypothetical protein
MELIAIMIVLTFGVMFLGASYDATTDRYWWEDKT